LLLYAPRALPEYSDVVLGFRQGETGHFQPGDALVEAGELPGCVSAADRARVSILLVSRWPACDRRLICPRKVVGLEMILSLRASGTVASAGPVIYSAVEVGSFYRLRENWEIALYLTSLLV